MPATATVSAWRKRAVDRTVAVAAMARSYADYRPWRPAGAHLHGPGVGNPRVCR